MPTKDIVEGVIRHLLTWGGGAWLINVIGPEGITSMAQLIAAIVMALVGTLWSIQDKRRRVR